MVVDDFSPGDCKAIVDEFQGRARHLNYVRHEENQGVLCARFTGAGCSTGDYVTYVDADDVAVPNFVESLLTEAIKTGADIVGSLREPTDSSYFTVEGTEALLRAIADRSVDYAVCTKLYRKSLLMSLQELRLLAKSHRLETPEDLLLNVFCALQNVTYANVPLHLIEYTKNREGSLTSSMQSRAVRRNIESRTKAYSLIQEAGRGFEDSIDKVSQRSASFFYRRTLRNCDSEDLEWAASYLRRQPGGNVFAALLFEASAQEHRNLLGRFSEAFDKLTERTKKLADATKQLRERTSEATRLSKQLRKRTSEATRLSKQLKAEKERSDRLARWLELTGAPTLVRGWRAIMSFLNSR